MRRRCAFTLVELLVVIAILGLVIGVIASCIAAGLRVWDVARSFHVAEADSFIGIEIVEKDICNTFFFKDIQFAGGVRQLSFATLLDDAVEGRQMAGSAVPQGRASDWHIGTIRYVTDFARGELLREVWRYSPSEQAPLNVRSERVMKGIEDVTFSYLASSKGSGPWLSEWNNATNLPQAVRLTVRGREGGTLFVMERLIVLPISLESSAGAKERPGSQPGR